MEATGKTIAVPETLKKQVVEVTEPVMPADIDSYARWREVEDRSHKLRKVIEAWSIQQEQERILRREYARNLWLVLLLQVVLVNAAFFLIGFRVLIVDPWVANGFILSVFGELAAMTFVVVRYLFPKVGSDVLALIEKL
jgi:hypothetical protein